jgi:signal transduction histidine kinase
VSDNPVSQFLRSELASMQKTWEKAILKQLPVLQTLERGAVIDHLPEFMLGLAAWVDGDDEEGRKGFAALVEGHALQRLGHGIPLEVLTVEYQVLRTTICTALLAVESSDQVRQLLIRVNEGIDFATSAAVHRYTGRRDEIRERFISILGHDLRNPLSSILLGAATIAALPCATAKHATTASIIQRSAERMQRMIADVMDFAQAHLGDGIPSVPAECDMRTLATEAARELQLANPERVITLEANGDLRGAWDKDRVIQALSNLIGNSVQHGTDPIRIVVDEAADHMSVRTRVENRGRAIPTGELNQLFQPFGPNRDPAKRRSGLGLGLFIVQQIAIAHGALCKVTSDDELTAFEINWPRVPLSKVSERD